MYSISPLFETYLREFQHEWDIKADVGGKEYGKNTIVDFDIEGSLISSDEFEIGTVIVSKLKLRLRTFDEAPANARVVPYLALNLSNLAWRDADFAWEDAEIAWEGGNTDWLPLGEFFIDSREEINGVWVFTCFDKLIFANAPYISSLTYPATMQQVWDEICTRLGFTYDSSVVIDPAYIVPVGPAGYTYREVMGHIAGANCASVYVGRDGLIKFKKFAANYTPDFDMSASDYIRVRQTNPVKTYTRVVIFYDREYDLFYEAGIGDENHTLYLEVPFATQQMANDILTAINGFSYVPIEMDSRGFPHLEPGDAIQFDQIESVAWEDADFSWESADMPWDGVQTYQTHILHRSLSFKGGLKMSIEAPSKSEQQSEFQVEGTLTQQVNRLTRTSVKKEKLYYGVTITDDEGLTVERSDNLAKVILNADEFRFIADGEDALWFDVPNRRWKFTGTLEGADGIFTGTLEAGTIIGGTIEGTEITGSLITGGTITGALIQTSVDTYPRIELSSTSQILKAAGAAGKELTISAGYTGSPAIVFDNNGDQGLMMLLGDTLLISTPFGHGDLQISAGTDLELSADQKIRALNGFYLQSVGSIGLGTPSGYTTGALVWGTSKHGTAPHYYKNGMWHAITALAVDS